MVSCLRLIRENRVYQLASGTAAVAGGCSRDRDLLALFRNGRISRAVALEHLHEPELLSSATATAI